MGAIPDYPRPSTALDGTELIAGWKDGRQVAIPAQRLLGDSSAISIAQAQEATRQAGLAAAYMDASRQNKVDAQAAAAAAQAASGGSTQVPAGELTRFAGADPTGVQSVNVALANADAAGPVTVPAGEFHLTADLTVTKALTMRPGAVLHADNCTLTIDGPFSALVAKCFKTSGTGQVLFGPNSTTAYIFPEWWGGALVSTNTAYALPITAPVNQASNTQWEVMSAVGYGDRWRVDGTGTLPTAQLRGNSDSTNSPNLVLDAVPPGWKVGHLIKVDGYTGQSMLGDRLMRIQSIQDKTIGVTLSQGRKIVGTGTGTVRNVNIGGAGSVGTGDAADAWKKTTPLAIWREDNRENLCPGATYVLGLNKTTTATESLFSPQEVRPFLGRRVVFGAWVKHAVKNGVGAPRIFLSSDGTGGGAAFSQTTSVVGRYQWLEVSAICPADATYFQWGLQFQGGANDTAYLGNPIAAFGNRIGQGNYSKRAEVFRSLSSVEPWIALNITFPTAASLVGYGFLFDVYADSGGMVAPTVGRIDGNFEGICPDAATPGLTGVHNLFGFYDGETVPIKQGSFLDQQVQNMKRWNSLKLLLKNGMCTCFGAKPGVQWNNVSIDMGDFHLEATTKVRGNAVDSPPPAITPTPAPAPTPAPPPSPPAFTPPTGFAANGATNAALKAMIQRVKAGTGRGRIVWKGDSTTVGQGGGTTSPYFLDGARPNRVPAMLAALLSTAGVPTLDNAMVADNGMLQANNYPLASYDPRFVDGASGASFQKAQGFAGGGYRATGTGTDSFTPTVPVDRFEVVIFNSASFTLTFRIDGAAPASLTVSGSSGGPAATASGNVVTVAAGNGLTRIIIAASSAGTHTLSWTGNNFAGALRSVMGWASGTSAIDQLVHASLGALSTDQATDNSGSNLWGNLEAIGFDAGDVTIIDVGLNDMNLGTPVATYQAAVQAMVTKAKASGDALVLFPYPAAAPFNNNLAAYKAAAASVASSSGVAFMSLFDYYGGTVDTSRFADGVVHGKAAFYADVAAAIRQALIAMNGGAL